MAKHKVIICCWEHGHQTELVMTRLQEDALSKKIDKLKAVCPDCRNNGLGNMPIFVKSGETIFNESKVYQCSKGHITCIGPLSSSMLHVRFGYDSENFFNIEGTIDELPELLDKKEIICHHEGCNCMLTPLDDFALSYPQAAGIKTKTRVGDLWDKAGLEPVRQGSYDSSGEYNETRSEKANKARLKNMRRTRNIDVNRLPGSRVDKSTDKKYGYRSKKDVNPERLK